MHPVVLEELESRCTAEEGECSCVLCEGKRVAITKQQERSHNEFAARIRATQAEAAEAAEIEARVAELQTLPPAQLAELAEPTHAELQMAHAFAHAPRKVSPLALLHVRRQQEVEATLESLISKLEMQVVHHVSCSKY